MYYGRQRSDGSTEWITKRGSSKLEGYHAHLNAVLSGNNYSPELADCLIALFNLRWNIARGIENR